MTLSLESIYQPFTDFFSNLFMTDAGSPVLFRFDKFGSVISDQDFIDPNHPELGYLPALVREKFSDLVNHIPVDLGDGMNIFLSADLIDDTYFFRLLSPSIPYIPDGIDDARKQAIISAFTFIKADALKIWNNLTLESITGLMLQYKPSLATPENWYDKSKNDVWTNHSFQVTETTSVPLPDPANRLWKLKLSDEGMRQILHLPNTANNAPEVAPLNIANRVLEVRANPTQILTPNVSVSDVSPVSTVTKQIHADQLETSPLTTHIVDSALVAHITDSEVATHNINIAAATNEHVDVDVNPETDVALHNTYLRQYSALNVSQRLLATQYLSDYIPRRFVQTTSISISFDYCVVNIQRPWYVDVFVNDKSWYIPTAAKGHVTLAGQTGDLPFMPIGFVAVRNLNIEANWTNEDIANAVLATDFGPFKVNATIVNNKLSYEGVQIIGWILQKMPDLPPNDSPASVQG